MDDENGDLKGLLAEARAIHFAMKHGVITYQQAKLRTQPILLRINAAVERISKEYKVKPKYIRFQDLGRSL